MLRTALLGNNSQLANYPLELIYTIIKFV